MFGIVFIFGILIYGIVQLIKNLSEDHKNKKEYMDSISNTYLSYDGTRRDLDTGEYRYIYHHNGDRYMCGDGIESINLSQIERNEKYIKETINSSFNKTVSYYSPEPINSIKRGKRYKDLRTGEIYLIREDRYSNKFYVTLDNSVVRFTDDDRRWKNEYKIYDKKKEIELVKEFQKEIDKASLDPFWKDPTIVFHKKGTIL